MQYLASVMSSSMNSRYSLTPVNAALSDEGIFAYAANEKKVGLGKYKFLYHILPIFSIDKLA